MTFFGALSMVAKMKAQGSLPSWAPCWQLALGFYREGKLISKVNRVLCQCCLI